MKNLKKNNKGFTLIELLAVIVILAILVVVAIPSITKYLDTSRRGAMADSVNTAIDAVTKDYMTGGKENGTYDMESINGLLSKKMNTSPFGGTYSGSITISEDVSSSSAASSYEIEVCIDTGDTQHKIEKTFTKNDTPVVVRSDIVSGTCSTQNNNNNNGTGGATS